MSPAAAVVCSPVLHRKWFLWQESCQRKPALPVAKRCQCRRRFHSITHVCCRWRVVAFACLPVCAGTCAAAAMGTCLRLPACVVLISLLDLLCCAGLAFLTLKNAHPHHRTSPDYPFLMYKGV